jgi:ABC-type antimicrobial peptide transport system permease subunit
LLGCLGAFALLALTNQQISFRGFTILLEMRWVLVAAGVGASLLLGLAGGIVPAFRVSRMPIVLALTREE